MPQSTATMELHSIVQVKWYDARHYSSWHNDMTYSCAPVWTVGYLLERTEEQIVVAQMYNPENEVYADIAVIPSGMLQTVDVLR